ncbi:MAG TPA: hypothetical protein VK166_18150, partial [Chitinophagaceae bacterium]|nr:hypothetical protein [Chitinophagaceae bacterium]
GLALLLFAYKFYRLFFIHSKLTDYLFSENLLHYEGGYIRRSLLGNLFIVFPEAYWKLAVISFYSLLMAVLIVYAVKFCRNIYALLIFFCTPFGLRMVMFDFGSIYRKEFIFYLVIILMIILYRKYRNHAANMFIAVVMSVLMVMIHESFIFLAMPVIAWILYINHAGVKRVIAYGLLTGIAFLLLSKIPSVTQLQTLDQFFVSRHIDWSRTREFMIMSKSQTLKMAIGHFMNGSIIFYLIFFIPIIGYLFYAGMVTRDMLILLGVQLLCCLAISIIAIDYGRWMSFVIMSFFICLFSYHDLNEFGERIRGSAREKTIYIVLLLFMLSMYLPHYIKNYDLPKNIVEYSFWEKINYSVSEVVKENQ